MKLILDAREAFRPKKVGKGQWTAGLLRELRSRDLDLTILADTDCTEEGAVIFPKGALWHLRAAAYVRRSGANAYLSPTSYIVPFLLGTTVPCVPIVHDLIAFRREPHNWKATLIERLLLRRVAQTAKHICTVSETTKTGLLHQFPDLNAENITSVFAGPMQEAVLPSTGDGKIILCVGTLCPRKNQARLIRAYASLPHALRSQYALVLVGARGWHDAEIVKLAHNTEGVTWKNYVSDDEYMRLLGSATVLAYPSLYEGFGMQVLDALQRGIPVLTSDRGSLKEVVGDAALIVNPEDERSIASGLTAILDHEDVRRKLASMGPERAKFYTWKQTADLLLASIAKALY